MNNARKSLEPLIPDSVEYFPWQIDGIRNLMRRSSFLLADEMGLGKSIQALTVFAVDVFKGRARRAIIVCPVTLKDNWANEIEKFTRFGYRVLEGTPKRRAEILEEFQLYLGVPSILIVNYEQVVTHLDKFNEIGFEVAIFDEAHFIKNGEAKRTKACLELSTNRNYLLTATPILNQADDLWPILNKIDPELSGGYRRFINRHCLFGGVGGRKVVGTKNQAELQEKLQRVMLRRLAKDHLPLGDPQIITRIVGLTPEQRAMYNQIKKDYKISLPGEPAPRDIENVLERYLRLKQICGTTATLLGLEHDHSAKLDLVIEDDSSIIAGGEKTVSFTQFLGVQEAYNARAKESIRYKGQDVPLFVLNGTVRPKDRQGVVSRWADINGPAILSCLYQVAGVGLNMIASHNIALIDKLYVPKLNDQAIGRVNRIGQPFPVQVRDYRVKNSVEGRIETICDNKNGVFDGIVEMSEFKKKLYEILTSDEDFNDDE